MKRRVKTIIGLACGALLCAGLAACTKAETELDKKEKENYIVGVVYDPNGGKFNSNRTGITVENRFNPDSFTDADNDGRIEISLKSTDPVNYSQAPYELGAPKKPGYAFAGWYRTRELSVDSENRPLDDYGNVLEKRADGNLYLPGAETPSAQGYVYSEMWDFNNDKLIYELGSGKYSLTLYAAWVPDYRFNYYYKEEDSSVWTLLGSTAFDYARTQTFKESYPYAPAVKPTADADLLWTPQWSGANETGEMVYTRKYSDGKEYAFPALEGHTFLSAYSDEACKKEIEGSLQHGGTLVYDEESEELKPENPVQNIYVQFEKGEQYRVTTADEFVKYAQKANASSVYTILAQELDFSDKKWPANLVSGEFAGKIVGNNCTFKNVSATNTSDEAKNGGLFASLAAGAEISDIAFVNATYDMGKGTAANLGMDGTAYFGLLTGYADAEATIRGVTIEASSLRMGKLARNSYTINLVGNGVAGISSDGVKVVLYGEEFKQGDAKKYRYFVTSVEVNAETGSVVPKIEISSQRAEIRDEESYIAYPEASN